MMSSFSFLWLMLLLLVSTLTVHAFVPPTTASDIRTCKQQPQQHEQPQRRHLSQLKGLEDLTSKLVMDGSTKAGTLDALKGLGLNPMVLGGGGGVVAILVLAAAVSAAFSQSQNSSQNSSSSSGSKSSTRNASKKQQQQVESPPPELVDLSIPYNAAALLAYQQVYENGQETDVDFVTFQQMYKEVAVAQVTLKRKQQQVVALEQAFAEKYPAAASASVVNGGVATEPQTA
jgi:hypothetical protein